MPTAAERPRVVRWHPRGFNNRLIFGATYRGVGRLPAPVSYAIGHVGTWLAYHAMRGATAALVDNLRTVFPDRSTSALKRLALMTYRAYAKDTIDFMRSLSMEPEGLRRMVGDFQAVHFDRALADGRGAIAVSAHFGNWEIGGMLLRRLLGYPVSVVVRPELSPAVNRMRREFRASIDIDTIEVRQHVDTALKIRRLLGENRVVGMLLDRHLDKDRVVVEFFGREAYFLRTPALMGYLTGAPLIPSFVFSRADGRIDGICCEPIRVSGADRDEAIRQATQAFAHVLERQIREHPQFWYQFYPFWATQPPATQEKRFLEPRSSFR